MINKTHWLIRAAFLVGAIYMSQAPSTADEQTVCSFCYLYGLIHR